MNNPTDYPQSTIISLWAAENLDNRANVEHSIRNINRIQRLAGVGLCRVC